MNDVSQQPNSARSITLEDIVGMKQMAGAALSPDGNWVAFVRSVPVLEKEKSERRQHIWLVPTDGGEPFQLTNGPNGDSGCEWSPDSTRLAFVSKRTGDKPQIWIVPIAGGEARQLTHAKNGAGGPRWSPDGQRIAFLMQEKDSEEEEKHKKAKDDPVVVEQDDFKRTCLWVIDVATMETESELVFSITEETDKGDSEEASSESPKDEEAEKKPDTDKSERLTEPEFHVSDHQWSPDSTQIAFVATPTPKADHAMFEATIQIVDATSKEARKLTQHDGGESCPRWSPDGQQIAFLYRLDDANHLQKDIYLIPAEGGSARNLTAAFDRSEVQPVWSPDGDWLYFETADGVRRSIIAVSSETGETKPLVQDDGSFGGFRIADDGDTYLCHQSTSETPMDLWVGSIQQGTSRQLTQLNPSLTNIQFGEHRVVQWESSDEQQVEGLLYLPADGTGQGYPLLVSPHGGPHGGVSLGFNPVWDYFASHGFAVFAPNFRGSNGYGAAFARGNYANWGVTDYQDMMTGVDFLIEQGIADPNRLVIGGWSYGGYMTAWTVTQTDRFKAACMGAGLSNLVSMYAQNDVPSFLRLYFEDGSPYEQLELYRERSPISHIAQVRTPTLIQHGANDTRVPVPQAEEFYVGLKAMGVEVEFVKYPREGHGIGEPRHRMDLIRRQLEWYQKHLPE